MSAPDKPLHEQLLDLRTRANLRPKDDDLLREAAAELSRMRTALEDAEKDAARYRLLRKVGQHQFNVALHHAELSMDEFLDAAIAEHALTAGSDK